LNLTYTPLTITVPNSGSSYQPPNEVYETDPAVNGTVFIALTDSDLYLTSFNLTMINPHVWALGLFNAGWGSFHQAKLKILCWRDNIRSRSGSSVSIASINAGWYAVMVWDPTIKSISFSLASLSFASLHRGNQAVIDHGIVSYWIGSTLNWLDDCHNNTSPNSIWPSFSLTYCNARYLEHLDPSPPPL